MRAWLGWMRQLLLLAPLVVLAGVWAQPVRALPFSDREDGISCTYYDVQLGIPWQPGGAGWLDTDNKPRGTRAHAVHAIEAGDVRRVRRIDATALVRGWWAGRWPNDGLLLRTTDGAGAVFHAREATDLTLRPQLVLQWPGGKRRFVEPVADATLDCSTYRGVGRSPTLTVHADKAVALRFDLARLQASEPAPSTAELVLVRPDDRPLARGALQVFRLQPPMRPARPAPADGLASRYPGDRGIAADPDVLFADGFEGRKPEPRWAINDEAPGAIVERDDALGFAPLSGRALRVTIPRNGLLGLDMRLRLRDAHGVEPEEVYFRYYLRLARDWLGAIDGGKLPGLAGTYNKAGWGGRPWDGNQGWSLRGDFSITPPAGHAAAGRVMLGTYAYHAKSSTYGDVLVWSDGGLAGLVEPERWYCIEQHLKLNTPGREDGVLQVWVDGRLALARSDLRLRDLPGIRIEEVWMNFYHGGTRPTPQAMHAWVDGVVIARRRIGPAPP
jgi:hypothetical protein